MEKWLDIYVNYISHTYIYITHTHAYIRAYTHAQTHKRVHIYAYKYIRIQTQERRNKILKLKNEIKKEKINMIELNRINIENTEKIIELLNTNLIKK